jgi:hypothetical protein
VGSAPDGGAAARRQDLVHLAAGPEMTRILAAVVAIALSAAPPWAAPAWAADESKCAVTGPVLWGDGEHDDTAALNAWFRGDRVVWARTGRPVGPQIGGSQSGEAGLGGRVFRLTGPVYIPSGTGRRIEQFEFVWPQRRERVSGGTIMAGADPAKPPVAANLVKIGTRPGEGVPFKTPDPKPGERDAGTNCLVS